MPSTPSVKRTPHDGIHAHVDRRLPAGVRRIEAPPEPDRDDELEAKVSSAMPRGLRRHAAHDLVASRAAAHRAPWNQITAAPASGMINSAGRIQRWYPIEARKAFMSSVPPSSNAECAENGEDTDDEHPSIGAELPDWSREPTHPTQRVR